MDNSNEVLKILQMIETGKITAQEGAALLNAINKTEDNESVNTKDNPKNISIDISKLVSDRIVNKGNDLSEAINTLVNDSINGNNSINLAQDISELINERINNSFDKEFNDSIDKAVRDSIHSCDAYNKVHTKINLNDSDENVYSSSGKNNRSTINIINRGIIKSGIYDKVSIFGFANIEGNVEIDKLTVNGECRAMGSLTVDNMCVFGKITTEGSVVVDYCNINGNMESLSDVTYDNLTINGKMTCSASANCDNLILNGTGEFKNIVCDDATIKGSIVVSEEFVADSVFLKGKFDINTLKADYIKIERDLSSKVFNSKCNIKNIECDNIVADYLDCDTLKCRKANLSDNCKVDKIIYID